MIDNVKEYNNTNKKIIEYLELFSKFVGIATIIAIPVGGINIYMYLKKIEYLFLFPEVVGFSYASMSALVAYFLLVLLIGIGFFSPFFSHIFLSLLDDLENNEETSDKNNHQSKPIISINPKWLNFIKDLLGFVKNYCFDLLTKLEKLLKVNTLARLIFGFIKDILLVFFIIFLVVLSLIAIPLLTLFFIFVIPLFIIYYFYKIIKSIIENIFFYDKSIERDILFLSKFIHYGFFGSALIFNGLFFINIFLKKEYFVNYIPHIICFFIILFLAYNDEWAKTINFKKGKIQTNIYLILLSLSQIMPFLIHFVALLNTNIELVNNLYYGLTFYIASIFIFGISSLFSHISFSEYFKYKKYDKYVIIANSILVFLYAIPISFFSNYELSLYKARFIEKPQDSSWYLIHNGNTNSENINGITKDDIKQIKTLFNAKNCENTNKKIQEKCENDNQEIFNNKSNALYGYMAWNLGNTKVFCPVSVDFFDNKDSNKEKSKNCLLIDGKYLQLINENFITNTTHSTN